jgi:hypothetical protein
VRILLLLQEHAHRAQHRLHREYTSSSSSWTGRRYAWPERLGLSWWAPHHRSLSGGRRAMSWLPLRLVIIWGPGSNVGTHLRYPRNINVTG